VTNADPLAVYEWMKSHLREGETLADVADRIPWNRIPNTDPGESMVTVTAREYRAELEARSDPEAAHMLAAMDKRQRG
jgi:hypothetical protein